MYSACSVSRGLLCIFAVLMFASELSPSLISVLHQRILSKDDDKGIKGLFQWMLDPLLCFRGVYRFYRTEKAGRLQMGWGDLYPPPASWFLENYKEVYLCNFEFSNLCKCIKSRIYTCKENRNVIGYGFSDNGRKERGGSMGEHTFIPVRKMFIWSPNISAMSLTIRLFLKVFKQLS